MILYLMTWNLLNSLTMFHAILFGGGPSALLPDAILTAILGLGLAFVYWRQKGKTA